MSEGNIYCNVNKHLVHFESDYFYHLYLAKNADLKNLFGDIKVRIINYNLLLTVPNYEYIITKSINLYPQQKVCLHGRPVEENATFRQLHEGSTRLQNTSRTGIE